MYLLIVLLVFGGMGARCRQIAIASSNASTSGNENSVKIAKCCELNELMVDGRCTPLNETNETTTWQPKLTVTNFQLKIGLPRCENNELVYCYPSSPDRLVILPSGRLRHYFVNLPGGIEKEKEIYGTDDDKEDMEVIHYDYSFGDYCADKVILSGNRLVATYAMVCAPKVAVRWMDTSYLMKHAVDPIFRAIAIASYLVVAIVYFVLPQLRDLVGNIITSMTLCLITSQCASMVRIFTEFGNHVNFLVADTVAYITLLAAFFWLNALGYYVWNTFRSRNVFLRVTDGRKYFYYSTYVWGSTFSIAATAIFAHFTLETNKPVVSSTSLASQETIGWLGIAVLFTSVAFTVIIDLYFVLTTVNTIKRMSTYGRIHHKMKYSFKMFVLLFAIMSIAWLSVLLSRLKYDVLVYCDIIVNLLQAILILYVCVFGQRRVTFLLGKTCNCCNTGETVEGLDWGEEMTAMNAGY